jgi:hypothetical protein
MIRPIVIQAAQFRVTWLLIGLLVGTMIVATAFALANVPRLGQPGGGPASVTQQHPGYGIGYPQHHGLAGPSWAQLGPQHSGYGTGYPLHGGLAGPSWVDTATE